MQEGAPLDRLLSGVAEIYAAPPKPASESGKTYFLNRLLRDVVFREAGLVQTGRAAREKQRRTLVTSLVAVGIATVVLLGLIVMNFMSSKNASADSAQVAVQGRR